MDEKLVVSLEVDASQATQGAQVFEQGLKKTVTTTNEAYKASDKYNEMLGESANRYNLIGEYVKNYDRALVASSKQEQQKLDKLRQMAQRLAEYSRQLVDAEKKENNLTIALEQAKRKYSETHLGGSLDTSQYDAAIQKATDAQIRYSTSIDVTMEKMARLEAERAEYVQSLEVEGSAVEKIVQKQDDVSDSSEKVSRNLVSMATSAASSAASMGGADGIANVLSAAGTSMRAIMTASGPAGVAIATITTLINLGATAFKTYRQSLAEVKERVDTLRASLEAQQQTYKEMAALEQYKSVLRDTTASTSDIISAREQLASTFPSLVAGWDSEGRAILATASAIAEYADQAERLAVAERAIKSAEAARELQNIRLEVDVLSDTLPKTISYWKQVPQNLAAMWAALRAQMSGKDVIQAHREAQEAIATDEKKANAETVAREEERNGEILALTKTMLSSLVDEWGLAGGDTGAAFYAGLDEWLSNTDIAFKEFLTSATSDEIAEAFTAFWEENSDRFNNYVEDFKAGMDGLSTSTQTLADKLSLAQKMQDVNQIKRYSDTLRTGAKSTDAYKEALAAVAKQLNITEDELSGNIKGYTELALKLGMATEEEYNLAIAAYDAEIAVLMAAAAANSTATDAYNDIMGLVKALEDERDIIKDLAESLGYTGGGGGRSSGGGSSREEQKAAWELELELIERVRSEMADLGDVYILMLRDMLAQHDLSATERARVEKELEHALRAVDGQMEQNYIDYLWSILREQKLSADQRLEIEKKLLQAQKELQRQQIEELNELGNAVVEALRAKYEAQRAAEEEAASASATARQKAHNEEIAAINDRRDAAVKAINAEIAALDEAWKARQRAQEDEDYDAQLAKLRRQLELEKDEYDQKKLLEQIAQVEEKRTETEAKRAYDDEKKRLQDQITVVRDNATEQINSLNAVWEAEQEALAARTKENEAYWAKRLSNEELQLEAIRVLNQESNEDILQLLKDYNPDYLQAGLDLGQMLYDGMNEKYADLLSRTKSVAAEIIRTMKEAMAYVGGGSSGGSSYSGSSGTQSVTPYSAEALIQTIAAVPDLVDMAITGALENMMASPRAYAAAKAEEAYAAGATTFALADLNTSRTAVSGVSGGTLTDAQRLAAAGYSANRINEVHMHYEQRTMTEAETIRHASREFARANVMGRLWKR